MTTVKAFTDGACKHNPGPGGWGVLLIYKDKRKEIYGGERNTTNNRMELTAIIKALETIKPGFDIDIYTDSKYVQNGITKWINNWKINNWRTVNGKEVKNVDLWEKLDELRQNRTINWNWIKAHNGHFENERADYLANLGIHHSKPN